MNNVTVRHSAGFTVVELMVVVVLVGILSALALPAFNDMGQNNRLTAVFNTMVGELGYARSEAIARNAPVSICGSSDDESCDSDDWHDGRLVFIDDGAGTDANAGNGELDAGETILKIFSNTEHGVFISLKVFADGGAITFSEEGTLEEVGSMSICDERGVSFAKVINFSIIGQSQKGVDINADEIVNMVDGENVTCP
ncbi:MAG: GspH/FimT family pseudopilin [Cellvibrionaceae bacterium]